MFSNKFRLHRLPAALLLAVAAEDAAREKVRRRRRRAELEAAETARRIRACNIELAERLRLSRIPAKPHLVPRMSAEQYAAAVAMRQRDREAAGIVRRAHLPARRLHAPNAAPSMFLSAAYLQEGLNDGRARAPKVSTVWLERRHVARRRLIAVLEATADARRDEKLR